MARGICLGALVYGICCFITLLPASAQESHKTWADYAGGSDSSKFVDLRQITKQNVDKLALAWRYPTRDHRAYSFNPIVVGSKMYVTARGSSLVALDAVTGEELWVHENLAGIASRGINFWQSPDHKDQRLILQINHYIEEIDAITGHSILSFGKNGLVDLREGLGRDPETVARIKSDTPGRVFENLVILGSSTGEGYMAPPGDLRAYDVKSGKIAWSFHTIPHPGEPGYETWPKEAWKYAGGTNTWGEISLDEKLGLVYFPTGSSTYDLYGADRIGQNLYANCLLALDARSGKLAWYFQFVHHDLWDYDSASAPQLVTLRHQGKMIAAVASAGKTGFLYVFDRKTGKPIWPIEERPVPKSEVAHEQAWPTQPFPSAPPPFARQELSPTDVDPYMRPDEVAGWKRKIGNDNHGFFTPPSSVHETVNMPGGRGGSNWGGSASDPSKGMVYLLTQDWPSFIPRVAARKLPNANGKYGASATGKTIFQANCQACHGEDRRGKGEAPSLVDIDARFGLDEFRQVLTTGKGDMPAFPSLADENKDAVYAYLVNPDGTQRIIRPTEVVSGLGGPVVASGGAPGGLVLAKSSNVDSYPADAPSRMFSDYGLEYPYVAAPPWSSLVAYDLNKGTIKWRVPLGEDPGLAAKGIHGTGVPAGGERRGMVVTSTGLIFVAGRDNKLRAFDSDTGKVLWTYPLPSGSEGLLSMYEVDGREFLAVPDAANTYKSREQMFSNEGLADRAYLIFALPK